MSDSSFSAQVTTFSQAPSLEALVDVVDVHASTPANPPEQIQIKFVGASYADAYAEAETFVKVSDEFAAKHGRGGYAGLERIVDFGSGWGRISRFLLMRVTASKIYALDVDDQMTALVNTTLPGVNAMTVNPSPPTVLADAAIDAALAFSVFSHLSGPAHEAWAREFGRVIAPGGVVSITVLDEAFFAQIAGAQAAAATGEADDFAANLATTFSDLGAARAGYDAGQIQFAGSGGGEVRTGDYYGWAAAPVKYVERVWGAAGFRIVEWVPSGVLFQQALVFLVRQRSGGTGGAVDSARGVLARQLIGNSIGRARRLAARVRRRLAS